MAKKLRIEGFDKDFIVAGCSSCPFNNDYRGCGLSRLLSKDKFVDFGTIESFEKPHPNCPLPDVKEASSDDWPNDGKHRIGPNGERLIAVDNFDSDPCAKCWYDNNKRPCYSVRCVFDNRGHHWELAGDRK